MQKIAVVVLIAVGLFMGNAQAQNLVYDSNAKVRNVGNFNVYQLPVA